MILRYDLRESSLLSPERFQSFSLTILLRLFSEETVGCRDMLKRLNRELLTFLFPLMFPNPTSSLYKEKKNIEKHSPYRFQIRLYRKVENS